MQGEWGSGKGQSSLSVQPSDVRDFLIENPSFLEDHDEILEFLIPPAYKRGDKVEDFQKFMLSRLQNHFVAIRGENDDLMDLMQDQLQRQNRINNFVVKLLDTSDFFELTTITLKNITEDLDHKAVGIFIEGHEGLKDLDEGLYGALNLVPQGFIKKYIKHHDLLMWDRSEFLSKTSLHAADDLFGQLGEKIQSVALLRLCPAPNLPYCLLALGSDDPLYYATGLATEQIEFLGAIIERVFHKLLTNPLSKDI